MIVQVTGSKYQVGCGKGYGIDVPDLEFKLNLIIDRDRSSWPEPVDTRTEADIASGVPGPPPVEKEIKEGDTFLFEGTIFAVDHDRLVQIISETGPLAFQRVFDSCIKPELEFCSLPEIDTEFSWDDPRELPENLSEWTPPYSWMKIWHENFCLDRNLREDYVIHVSVNDCTLCWLRDIYMKEWKVYYDPQDFNETELPWYIKNILCWFYSEVGRVKPKNLNP